MKHIKTHILILLLAAFTLTQPAYSQPRPPSDHGGGDDYSPQPAPIGSGLVILLVLAGGYGVVKLVKRKKSEE